MKITSVRLSIPEHAGGPGCRPLAVGSLCLDHEFVVHEVRVVMANHGPAVAMPSGKRRVPCPECGSRNGSTYQFCCRCGTPMPSPAGAREKNSDFAHPVTHALRDHFTDTVLHAYYQRVNETHAETGRA